MINRFLAGFERRISPRSAHSAPIREGSLEAQSAHNASERRVDGFWPRRLGSSAPAPRCSRATRPGFPSARRSTRAPEEPVVWSAPGFRAGAWSTLTSFSGVALVISALEFSRRRWRALYDPMRQAIGLMCAPPRLAERGRRSRWFSSAGRVPVRPLFVRVGFRARATPAHEARGWPRGEPRLPM